MSDPFSKASIPTKKTIEEGKAYTKIIAKAWMDEELQKRLLADPTTVLKEHGVEIPEGMTVKFMEAGKTEMHIELPAKRPV